MATLHRRRGNSTEVVWIRFYTKLSKALARGVELALLTGQPGDVLEISSSNFGYDIATVKLSVNAKHLSQMQIVLHTEDAGKIYL
jgi:hypothetical protein